MKKRGREKKRKGREGKGKGGGGKGRRQASPTFSALISLLLLFSILFVSALISYYLGDGLLFLL